MEDIEYQLLKDTALRCRNLYTWLTVEFELETAMWRSEILSLKWKNTNLDVGIAQRPNTKNGTKRDVPLTLKARKIISQMPDVSNRVFNKIDDEFLYHYTEVQETALQNF